MAKDKIQNITQSNTNPIKAGVVHSGAEGYVVPAPLVTIVVLLISGRDMILTIGTYSWSSITQIFDSD